ncbi:MAG TPA: PIN domain-containing protein [Vicinamibacteria bacterium]|nr:PIN domain-containing protein [Vicinamibacteria bacterium]
MAASDRTATVGLDTSVVLRLVVGTPDHQAATALAFVRRSRMAGRRIVVSDLVVSEAYFALHAHYDVPKQEAITALREVLRSGLVEPADGPAVIEMLDEAARSSSKPGFVDRLIHAHYERLPASMATFERAAGRLPATTVLR